MLVTVECSVLTVALVFMMLPGTLTSSNVDSGDIQVSHFVNFQKKFSCGIARVALGISFDHPTVISESKL